MKKLLTTLLLLGILFLFYWYRNDIIRFCMIHIVYRDELILKNNNDYTKYDNWSYVQKTDQFYPNNQQDILNIFYTALNGGWDEVTFYCEEKYKNCMDDVKTLTEDSEILSTVNNFVPTFNSYNRIYVNMNSFGRVHIQIEKLYQPELQKKITEKVDQIYEEIIKEGMTDTEKIKTVHDYIINHTVYDQEKANSISNQDSNTLNYSNTAYGPFYTGKAICGGYTDAMALFLDKMGIQNYKISSARHIWNFVYVDGTWKHLDLTWDDPVISTGENILTDTFFLISSEELKNQNTGQHEYNASIYKEAS